RTRLHLPDDVFGRARIICRLHDVERHLGMDDDADAGMLGSQLLDLADGKARVDGTMSLPQNHSRFFYGFRIKAAPYFVRIPQDHLVERYAHLVGGVSSEVLVGEKQNFLAALPGPLQGRRSV